MIVVRTGIAEGLVRLDEKRLLVLGPGALAQRRVDVVAPALAALLGGPHTHLHRHSAPAVVVRVGARGHRRRRESGGGLGRLGGLQPEGRDQLQQQRVLLPRPRPEPLGLAPRQLAHPRALDRRLLRRIPRRRTAGYCASLRGRARDPAPAGRLVTRPLPRDGRVGVPSEELLESVPAQPGRHLARRCDLIVLVLRLRC